MIDAGSSKVDLAEPHGKTVGIDEPIKVVQSDLIRIDDGYLFEACPGKGF